MDITYEMSFDDAQAFYFTILLIVDRQATKEDKETLAAIAKRCFAFWISNDGKPSSLSVLIEPRLLGETLQGMHDLWLNIDAARLHVNVLCPGIPGTPYLFKNMCDILPVLRSNIKRIKQMLAERQAQ